jgi:hypothetical protein
MEKHKVGAAAVIVLAALFVIASGRPAAAQYNSGSSGVHGVFPPVPQSGMPGDAYYIVWNVLTGAVRYCNGYTLGTGSDQCDAGAQTNVLVQIPGIQGTLPSGVYEFTNDSIPPLAGQRFLVPVGYSPNVPLSILSMGDINIQGGVTIYMNGWPGRNPPQANVSVAGGKGGPGGFDGGASGNGGGAPGNGAAGFGASGGAGGSAVASTVPGLYGSVGNASQLNPSLTPLSGGSGGGGGAGIAAGQLGCENAVAGFGGGGGGGGGGALLLAASGRVTLTGVINAYGGNGGQNGNTSCRLYGGAGAGGSVRIVAQEFVGAGSINVSGGVRADGSTPASGGFVRTEAALNTFTGGVTGQAGGSSISFPTAPIPTTQPILQITSVAGTATPASPLATLAAPDITFANPIQSPVTVLIAASNVPLSTTVTIKIVPATGTPTTATSSGLAGSVANSTASATVTLPPGAGVITATATFSAADLNAALFPGGMPLINGQRPERVEVTAMADGTSHTYLIAASGARLEVGELR